METPKTLLQAARYFADLDVCENYMREIKWHGDEPACPHCGSKRVGEIKTRRLLRCKDCRKQFSSKVGTIFEDSPLGLDKWFVAVWAIANCKDGISSHELSRTIGVTQKTAWFMLHRIRVAMEVDNVDLNKPRPDNNNDRFCSELVAGWDKIWGILPGEIPANEYTPDDYYQGGRVELIMPDLWERLKSMDENRRPKGIGKFTELLSRLVAVPKEAVKQRIAAKKETRKKRIK